MLPKTVSQRDQAIRERREALGLTRLEVYVHPDYHEAVKRLVDYLSYKRQADEGLVGIQRAKRQFGLAGRAALTK